MKVDPETVRQLLSLIRPEIIEIADKLVESLPEDLRKEWISRIMGLIAQHIERMDIGGFQEAISDVIEIISDEIGRHAEAVRPKEEEINVTNELKKILRNSQERLGQAENVEEERDRIITELLAYAQILEFYKAIEQRYAPKQERIDWEKTFEKLRDTLQTTYPKVKEEVKKQLNEFLGAVKEGWQKGRKKGLI
jgi:hypothetical protein